NRIREFLPYTLLRRVRLHLLGDDGQHAAAKLPDVLCDQHDANAAGHDRHQPPEHRADDAMTDAPRHASQLTADEQADRRRDALAAFDQHRGRRYIRPRRFRIDGELLAGIARHHPRDGGAETGTEERLQALQCRLRRVEGRQLDIAAHVLTYADSELLDGHL